MAAVERERLETGVQFVGAGPATLSAAIRLVALCRERGIDPPEMLVIEKVSRRTSGETGCRGYDRATSPFAKP